MMCLVAWLGCLVGWDDGFGCLHGLIDVLETLIGGCNISRGLRMMLLLCYVFALFRQNGKVGTRGKGRYPRQSNTDEEGEVSKVKQQNLHMR